MKHGRIVTVFGKDVLQIPEGIIVHGCNAQGAMGAGIAAQIREKFPDVYAEYKSVERTKGLHLGSLAGVVPVSPNKYIVNAITQNLFLTDLTPFRPVSYDAIDSCFQRVCRVWANLHDTLDVNLPVCFPKIGAGLGGGSWNVIQEIIEANVSNYPDLVAKLYIFEPQ